jgi:hypothetical protein
MDIYNQVKMLTLGKMSSINVDIPTPMANIIDDDTDNGGFIKGLIVLSLLTLVSWIIYKKHKIDKKKEKMDDETAQKMSENTFYKSI